MNHELAIKDPVQATRLVETLLRRCTDCEGAASVMGVPPPIERKLVLARGGWAEPTGAPLRPLGDLVADAKVADRQHLDISFKFLPRVPDRPERLPYRITKTMSLMDQRSTFALKVPMGMPAKIMLSLWWPFDDVCDPFLQSHDAMFELLGIVPRPARWFRGVPTAEKHRPFAFDRGAFVPPPDDDVGRRLHEEALARPDDVGMRLAYADWLTGRGNPLGEMLVLQHQILETRSDDERMPVLIERSRALLAAHGMRWSHVLVPRG